MLYFASKLLFYNIFYQKRKTNKDLQRNKRSWLEGPKAIQLIIFFRTRYATRNL